MNPEIKMSVSETNIKQIENIKRFMAGMPRGE